MLEDPAVEPPPYVYQRTISPMEAPDKVTEIEIGFEKGDAVSVDGKRLSPAELLTKLNKLGLGDVQVQAVGKGNEALIRIGAVVKPGVAVTLAAGSR